MKVIIKVEKSDLVGDIKDFPIEIVKKMVEEQMAQGNAPDVSIFQEYASAPQDDGGFDWDNTDDNGMWSAIIDDNNFDSFFEKYPEKEGLDHLVYIIQDGSVDSDELMDLLESFGGVNDNNYSGYCNTKTVYYINPITKVIELESDEMCDAILPQLIALNYTEIKVDGTENKPNVVEYTIAEIAEKLGVDASCLRIKM